MENSYRKLYRSTRDRRIAGVCGGLAEYLNIDPTVVRIIFLVSLLFGMGFFIYIIIWICAPEEGTLR